MAGKRKRNRAGHGNECVNKRQKVYESLNGKDPVVKDALLSQYYPQVFSLREYLISKLPTASKIRRKKILSVGRKSEGGKDQNLAEFLDQTLVGVLSHKDVSPEERLQQWTSFSQRNDTSDSNIGNLSGIGQFSMSEVFICSLFGPSECIVLATDIRRSSTSPSGCSSQRLETEECSISYVRDSRKTLAYIEMRSSRRQSQAWSRLIQTVT
jgi:hypothetical protein